MDYKEEFLKIYPGAKIKLDRNDEQYICYSSRNVLGMAYYPLKYINTDQELWEDAYKYLIMERSLKILGAK
jgi:hypothetical protein